MSWWTEPQSDEERDHLVKRYEQQNKARGRARHAKRSKAQRRKWKQISHNVREAAIEDRLNLR